MTNKNPVLRIQIPQILTSNFMMKYYYDDSIREVSEKTKKTKVAMSASQGQGHSQRISMVKLENSKGFGNSFDEMEKQKIDKELANSSKLKESFISSNSLKPPSVLENNAVKNKGNSSKKSFNLNEIEGVRSVDFFRIFPVFCSFFS